MITLISVLLSLGNSLVVFLDILSAPRSKTRGIFHKFIIILASLSYVPFAMQIYNGKERMSGILFVLSVIIILSYGSSVYNRYRVYPYALFGPIEIVADELNKIPVPVAVVVNYQSAYIIYLHKLFPLVTFTRFPIFAAKFPRATEGETTPTLLEKMGQVKFIQNKIKREQESL
ncbi:hypothetical protein [Lactococcus lactis]|uniref:hypothetical protein n=1 Tax=Lactococcus lactis TaxID=1358 RepID=UPI0018C6017F|nr:hypothetical protein [Lactococcus lactis]MBG1279291.1 hypothetical protein [Lactococcus lactis subsp. lactis]